MTGRVATAKRRTIIRELPFPRSVEGIFRRLAGRPNLCWLDSVPVGGAPSGPEHLCRWSVITSDPAAVLTHNRGTTLLCDSEGRAVETAEGSPFPFLREVLRRHALAPAGGAGPEGLPLQPGLIGYLAYDLGHYVEPTVPQTARDDISLPELHLPLYDHLLLLDHKECQAYGLAVALECSVKGPEAWLDEMAGWVVGDDAGGAEAAAAKETEFACNFTRSDYLDAVARAHEYIAAGDIFQVNLSQRFTAECDLSPADVYLRLRRANPAPFSAFMSLGDPSTSRAANRRAVLSSSPELFLNVRDRQVLTRPIKGTRPRRPGDESFNRKMQQELLASEKDAAELVMIVDLERNDLGRVCDYGTVRVAEPRILEGYASVYHSVACVEGELFKDADLVDLLKATFPGGSITGAPKVRAMQIIDELEPTRRSVYTGALGYIGLDGQMELNIAIRTLIQDGGRVHLQVGGGIVADSTPEGEYDETLDKARSLFAALRGGEM